MATLRKMGEWYTGAAVERKNIKKIEFYNSEEEFLNNHKNTYFNHTWDCSDDGLIVGYRRYTDLICIVNMDPDKDAIYMNEDSSHMFSSFESVTEIKNFDKLICTKVKYANSMFHWCYKLISIKLFNNFDYYSINVSLVQNMDRMFEECLALEEVTFGDFHPYSLTDMSFMFVTCPKIKTIKMPFISKISHSHGVYANSMFYRCENLEVIDFNCNNNTKPLIILLTCDNMFNGCKKLTSIDFRCFDTSICRHMRYMFYENYSLQNLILGLGFHTHNVKDMSFMFSGCRSIETIDLSLFNTSNVTDMNNMFSDCPNLKILDVSNFDTKNVKNMRYMFYDCQNLKFLNVKNFNTSKVQDMYVMFFNCFSIKELDLSNFDTSSLTTGIYWGDDESTISQGTLQMFGNMRSLEYIKLNNNFKFNLFPGSTQYTKLPNPSANYITNADGYWYDLNGNKYTADNLSKIDSRNSQIFIAYPPQYYRPKDNKIFINTSTLIDIADAIREKTGETGTFTALQMANKIRSI